MLILPISDTHNQKPALPEADLLIHCGDLTGRGTYAEFATNMRWLDEVRHRFPLGVWFTPGNHDRGLDAEFIERYHGDWLKDPARTYPPLYTKADPDDIHILFARHEINVRIDSAREIGGVKFYFSPWTPPFMYWAFMMSEEKLEAHYANIPDDTEVLVCHGPPRYLLDRCPSGNVGSDALARRIKELKRLRLVCFGHIHESHGYREENGVLYVNCSVLDGFYNGFNPIFVIDTEDWKIHEILEDKAV